MGPATRLKNAVIDKGAMWEPVQQVTECVAHVKCILENYSSPSYYHHVKRS